LGDAIGVGVGVDSSDQPEWYRALSCEWQPPADTPTTAAADTCVVSVTGCDDVGGAKRREPLERLLGDDGGVLGAVLQRTERSATRRVQPSTARVHATGAADAPRATTTAALAPRRGFDAARPAGDAGDAVKTERTQREDDMWARLKGLGMIGELGEPRGDEWASGHEGGGDTVARLRERLRRKTMANWDLGRIGTMASWWDEFLRHTGRVPFLPLRVQGEIAAGVYNAQTLELFAEYMRERGHRKTGAQLSADHISAIVGTARTVRSQQAHYDVAPSDTNNVLGNIFKRYRAEDGTKGGDRRESRGFRARDFREIVRSFDRLTRDGEMEWGVALAAWSFLLRGCEVGRPNGKAFEPGRGITVESVTPRSACAASNGLPWCTVDVVAAKDCGMRHRPIALPIRQRIAGGGDDPLCAYSAIMRVHNRRLAQLPQCTGPCEWCKRSGGTLKPAGNPPAQCARANAPLFVRADGQAYTTKDVDALGSRMAAAAGIPPGVVGGKLWRIGGATDLWEVLGAERAKDHIKRRGRWKSDIWEVYQRTLLGAQLDAAAGMATARDEDIEAVCPGWVQPAGVI
jgi:hypothetical protein